VIVVNVDRPVRERSPVNVTPALVIVQSFAQPNTPDASGDAAVQLHSEKHVDELGGNEAAVTGAPAAH
jgi:hypothetical protein